MRNLGVTETSYHLTLCRIVRSFGSILCTSSGTHTAPFTRRIPSLSFITAEVAVCTVERFKLIKYARLDQEVESYCGVTLTHNGYWMTRSRRTVAGWPLYPRRHLVSMSAIILSSPAICRIKYVNVDKNIALWMTFIILYRSREYYNENWWNVNRRFRWSVETVMVSSHANRWEKFWSFEQLRTLSFRLLSGAPVWTLMLHKEIKKDYVVGWRVH